jgi:hypothetical protein
MSLFVTCYQPVIFNRKLVTSLRCNSSGPNDIASFTMEQDVEGLSVFI